MDTKVFLVGAGPGDKELITVKGQNKLKQADVILYDRLSNDQLLEFASEDTELIYVGKKPGNHSYSQEEINQLLVDKAKAGNIVVRLKGGDPFIFGRGGEEALRLSQEGIAYQVVPGVTSPIGAAAYAGIPLTTRDISSSVIFLTGHQVAEINWTALHQAADTIVIFMGVGNLAKIVKKLKEVGCKPDTPIAMVEWATTKQQKTLISTLEQIVIEAKDKIIPPALIIIGQTVKLNQQLTSFEDNPLFGKKILVTRPKVKLGDFSQKLDETGAEVITIPAVEITKVKGQEAIVDSLNRIRDYNWLVFTSTVAVDIFMEEFISQKEDIRSLAGVKLAAVGNKTAQALNNYNLKVDLLPDEYTGTALLKKFKSKDLTGQRILLARADKGRKSLPKGLRKAGAKVDDLSIYQIVKTNQKSLAKEIINNQLDMIVLTSPLAVESIIEALGNDYQDFLAVIDLACIGPVTADKVKSYNLKPAVIPEKYNLEQLFTAIKSYY